MTFEAVIRSARLRNAVRTSALGPFIDGFVDAAAGIGYTDQSLYGLVLGATQFARYMASVELTDVSQLRRRHVDAFIETLPRYRCRHSYWMRQVAGTRAAHHVIEYLRRIGATPPEPRPVHPYSWVLDEWTAFLRQHRGLAPASVDVYRRGIEPFLQGLGADATADRLVALTAERVHAYVERHAGRLARATRKNLVITVRSFLRFAFSRGFLAHDLGHVVPRVPCFSQDRLPRGPKWADVAKLLTTVDRSTAQGRRDFAMLLILITYGVRRSQVVDLRLDDLDWRASTLRMPASKRGRRVVVPITAAVGDALVAYLRARPTTVSRSIFLSMDPPFRPLAAGSVYNVVSEAFRRAKIPTPHRGSHAIRHAWATRALEQGHRLKTIADLLGHRSLESTRIYAKVDVTQLRTVALPWPVAEVR
jgi:site-specific recombinase XerD